MKSWFRKTPPPRQSGNKTWTDFENLYLTLGNLCEKTYNNRGDIRLYIGSDGMTSLTLKLPGGSEFKANGRDPWEAAAELTKASNSLGQKIAAALTNDEWARL
jgi:hypothetical protein